jgi:hypothetical protein
METQTAGVKTSELRDRRVIACYNAHMKKVIRVFHSHAAAEKSDREFYKSLSGQERLEILLTLIARNQKAVSDENGTGLKRVYRVIKRT